MTVAQASSRAVLKELDEFLNRMEKKCYRSIQEYYEEKGGWPTYKELAEFMDVDKNTVQPRISELKKRMLVTEAGKRPCRKSDHNISVTTWKTVIE